MPCRLLPLLVLWAIACERPAPLIENVHWTPAATMVAIPTGGGLLLATVTPREVRPVRTIPDGDHFGWLDAHTLIVTGDQVVRYVDGQRAQSIPLHDPWVWARPIFTSAGEVWLERCGGPAVPTQSGCDDLRYLQVTLDGAQEQRQPPLRITMPSDGTDPYLPWPRLATVSPPAGFRASLGAGGQRVECTTGERTTTYPSQAWSFSADAGFVFTSVRWVQTDPPILEMALDVNTPIGTISHSLNYVRGCAPRPLDGYVKLGEGVWAAYVALYTSAGFIDLLHDGTWSFYVGATLIGELGGHLGIRASGPLRSISTRPRRSRPRRRAAAPPCRPRAGPTARSRSATASSAGRASHRSRSRRRGDTSCLRGGEVLGELAPAALVRRGIVELGARGAQARGRDEVRLGHGDATADHRRGRRVVVLLRERLAHRGSTPRGDSCGELASTPSTIASAVLVRSANASAPATSRAAG